MSDAPESVPGADPAADARWSRRRLLGFAGVGAATAAVAGTAGLAVGRASAAESAPEPPVPFDAVDFHGPHQAGIITPAQDRLHLAAFDVITDDRAELVELLRAWTDAARAMTQGQPVGSSGAVGGALDAPPEDTGEALGLSPANLTITFGFGPTLFTVDGQDRFGLAARRPAALERLPHFPGDQLDPARSDGDLVVQACADDPQVAVHAVRNLARIAFGVAGVRWSQLGFGRTASTSRSQETPRNLFGFKDGTNNLKAEDRAELDRHVWVAGGDDPAADWLAGGSYLVARRINMHIETWDRTSLREQEAVIGRAKGTGAPLSGGDEFTPPDFAATVAGGDLALAETSHVHLAHAAQNDGARMLRRGYNFTDGSDGLGRLDAGLFFLAFVRDPRVQYVPMQTTLARDDALSEYLEHRASALFAVPPGVIDERGYVGEGLFS